MINFDGIGVYGVQQYCYNASKAAGWWDGVDVNDVVTTKLVLIHGEVSEAMEGFRKDLMDDHLPHRKNMEVEMADAVIRIFDLAGALGFNLQEAMEEKMAYNAVRLDHKKEAREAAGGKKF